MVAVVGGGCQYQMSSIPETMSFPRFASREAPLPQVCIPDCVISLDIDINPHKRLFCLIRLTVL